MSNQFLEAALRYAVLGWRVFPCVIGQKVPLTAHGVKDATTDQDQICAWWSKWPGANVAVACGNGLYVVDVDVSASGEIDGHKSLKEFLPLPETVRQSTPRGGFHAFYKATVPPTNKNGFRPGIDIRGDGYYVVVAPSIHPNGGQYIWTPDCAPWERELAEFPDFMRPASRPPWASPPSTMAPQVPQEPASDEVLRRASLYLQEVPGAVQGQQGHAALLWAATALVHGFGLSDQQVWDLLALEYNPRCQPPWDLTDSRDHKDFSRKVREARRLTPDKPRLWLLNETEPAGPPVHIDVEALVAKATEKAALVAKATATPAPEPEPIRPSNMDGELRFLAEPVGLVGWMCSWINETSAQYQPLLTLGATLAFCGALFGRKVRTMCGLRTNVYCMGIAKSTAGKNYVITSLRRLCDVAGCTHLLGGNGWASSSALEKRMANEPATVFLCDEIGHKLLHIKSGRNQYAAQIVPTLMDMYTSAGTPYLGQEYAEDGKQRTLIQPCCCLYGTSTEERFMAALSPDELQDGWLSRCLVFHSHANPRRDRAKNVEPSVPEDMAALVRKWDERKVPLREMQGNIASTSTYHNNQVPPEPIVVSITADADRVFAALEDKSWDFRQEHPHLANLWGRAEENAKRIALIVAAGDNFESPVITAQIADYACRLVWFLLCEFSKQVPKISESRVQQDKQRLLEAIRRGGVKGCLKSKATKETDWMRRHERDATLADLIEAEEVVSQKIPGAGRPAEYLWTTENYQKWLGQQK